VSWHTYSGKFDPAEFNVPPSLKTGTSQRLQLYIQSAHARALGIIAHSGHFPWGNAQDVARWAIAHGLRYIDTIDPGPITSHVKQANIMDAIAQEEHRKQKFLSTFDSIQQSVNEHRASGDAEMARELVNRVWREIVLMPDEPDYESRWKKKYMDRFEQLFKEYIVY
jgi:hypothetical protein